MAVLVAIIELTIIPPTCAETGVAWAAEELSRRAKIEMIDRFLTEFYSFIGLPANRLDGFGSIDSEDELAVVGGRRPKTPEPASRAPGIQR